jgi:hypothetical protein
MNRQLMLFLATAVFASLLSGAPAAAQGQGQGTFGVDTCEPAKTACPSGAPNAFGVCVAFANVCSDALRTGNPQLFATCCVRCLQFDAACGLPDFTFCAGDFTPALNCRPS